jgi:hypothetical protein
MPLELTEKQNSRMKFFSGDNRGNYKTTQRTDCFKITPTQVIKIKKLHDVGKSVKEIADLTELSRYIVRRAIAGFYNHILK